MAFDINVCALGVGVLVFVKGFMGSIVVALMRAMAKLFVKTVLLLLKRLFFLSTIHLS